MAIVLWSLPSSHDLITVLFCQMIISWLSLHLLHPFLMFHVHGCCTGLFSPEKVHYLKSMHKYFQIIITIIIQRPVINSCVWETCACWQCARLFFFLSYGGGEHMSLELVWYFFKYAIFTMATVLTILPASARATILTIKRASRSW